MKRVTTETGSVYLIDLENKTWERIQVGETSGRIRSDQGSILNAQPLRIIVGESMYIITDMINPAPRFLTTSPVVSIEDV